MRLALIGFAILVVLALWLLVVVLPLAMWVAVLLIVMAVWVVVLLIWDSDGSAEALPLQSGPGFAPWLLF